MFMKHEVLLFSFTFTVALSCKYNPPFEMHFSYLLDDSWFLDHPFYTVMLPYELFYTRQQLFIVQTKVMNLKLQEYNTPSLQKHSRCRAQGIPKHWLVFYTHSVVITGKKCFLSNKLWKKKTKHPPHTYKPSCSWYKF